MTTRTAVIVILVLAGLAGAASLALYPQLPERVPTHWNMSGHADGWSGKPWAISIMMCAMLAVLLFTLAADWLSPRHFKVGSFRPAFNYLMVTCAALMAFLHAIMLLNGLYPARSFGRVMITGLFVFFAWIGNRLGKIRRNFWLGIRTPWTLASDAVWIATHRLAARVLVGTGILGAVCVAFGAPPAWCLLLLLAGLMVPVVYSFWLSKKLEKTPEQGERG